MSINVKTDKFQCCKCELLFEYKHPTQIEDPRPPCPRCGSKYYKWLNAKEYGVE